VDAWSKCAFAHTGLRADILTGGRISRGDTIVPVDQLRGANEDTAVADDDVDPDGNPLIVVQPCG